VKYIYQIKKTSIWIFVVPVFIINLCLFISIYGDFLQNTLFQVDAIGRSSFTIPYIDGGTSISRVSRTYPAYLLFKPGMLITAILLIKYWFANKSLFNEIDKKNNLKKYFLFFGVGSSLFLIIHSLFLGLNYEVDLYKFFRRFVLLAFIIFEIIAQTILIINIFLIKDKIKNLINSRILLLKAILVSLLIAIALFALPMLNSDEYTHFKHALEWNFFIGVISFYLLTFFFWKKPRVHTSEDV